MRKTLFIFSLALSLCLFSACCLNMEIADDTNNTSATEPTEQTPNDTSIFKNTSQHEQEHIPTESQNAETVPTVPPETIPTTPDTVQALLGKWYLYTGGVQDDKGNWSQITMFTLSFTADGQVEFSEGVVQSEYYANYYGTWQVKSCENNSFRISLDMVGGALVLGEEPERRNCDLDIQATVSGNRLTIQKIHGDDPCTMYGEAYERNLSSDTWKERQIKKLSSIKPDASYIGEWCYDYISNGNWNQVLTIHSIEGNTIYFDLFYYRLASFDNQTAIIQKDGTAHFTATTYDNEYALKGILAFGDTVTVYITHSADTYVDAGICEYTRAEKEETEIIEGNEVGNRCPSYALPIVTSDGETGNTIYPGETGKITIINFWGTWCGPCINEMPYLDEIARNYADSVTVIAVHSVQERNSMPMFLAKNYPDSPIIFSWDRSESYYSNFYLLLGGSGYYPYTIVLNAEGVITDIRIGSMSYDEMKNLIENAKVSS